MVLDVMNRLIVAFVLGVFVFSFGYAQQIEGSRYKGFVAFEYKIGNDGIYGGDGVYNLKRNACGVGLMTSHGSQINQFVYLGAGFSFDRYTLDNMGRVIAFPLFVHFRANMNKTRVSPFFDLKTGYSPFDLVGFYLSPNFGIRFGIGKRLGIDIEVGVALQGYKIYTNRQIENAYIKGLNISLGLDF